MSTRVVVLGCGLVGRMVVCDLADDPDLQVVAADRSASALAALEHLARVETRQTDLARRSSIAELAEAADLVVGAVPGALGRLVQQTVLEAARPLVDIAFAPEDPLELDELARERGVTAVVDCGVAPGLSNLLAANAAAELDELGSVRIYVGGLPFRRVWPYEYQIVFSPSDVIEEYTRPCRLRENGREVVRAALSEVELLDFAEVGTLEAFNTDGLRTLLQTLPATNLVEKTLRYPGHAERMRVLRESGFFDEEPLDVGPVRVAPRAVTERLLFRAWSDDAGDGDEFTLLRVRVEGSRSGGDVWIQWDLFDRTDRATGFTSMARTSGFPCAIVARLVADKTWSRPGVHPLESLGRDAALTTHVIEELGRRNVSLRRSSGESGAPALRTGHPDGS